MEYSKLSFRNEWQSDALLVAMDWRKNNEALLLQQRPVENHMQPLMAEFPEVRRLEFDYLSSGSLTIVSSRLADFLKIRINAEFIPIHGTHGGRPYTAKQFHLVHFFDQPSALDLAKSSYTLWPQEAGGGIQGVSKLVLDPLKVNGSSAFILDELAIICIRNDVCKEIELAGFEGLKFTPLSQYKGIWSV